MKKQNILFRYIQCSAFIMLALSLASCKKDELRSSDMYVYMRGEYGTLDNSIVMPFVHSPIDVSGNVLVSVKASTTRAVVADVDVTMTPDTSTVAAFNTKYKTSFAGLPPANYRVVNSNMHKITTGSVLSDSMQIEILKPETLNDTDGYLLPITISSAASNDKGVTISSNLATVYVKITYAFNNIVNTQTPLTGTLASRTAWSVTVSNTTSGALGPAMIDGNNATAWRSSNSSTAAKYAIVNMGSSQTIKGFQMVPNYVATTENPTQMTISTSADNVTWKVQGIWKGTAPATTSSATSPDIKGINFIAPVQAQYFRFDITAQVSGSRAGIGEVYIVQ
ncbi:MAG: discoidin domain-containing protein [Chitinophagaceae bacterium]